MSTTDTAMMRLNIVNSPGSGVDLNKINIAIIGQDPNPPNPYGYLDFTAGQLNTSQPFKYKTGTTSKTLAQIQAITNGPISIPKIKSARIYFAVGGDFATSEFPTSGPTASKTNPIFFDKIEFDTHSNGQCNINGTAVDFYGISYTISATPRNGVKPVIVGFDKPRSQIISAFNSIPASPGSQRFGNTGIFKSCIVKNDGGAILRVLSPKAMALSDWLDGGNNYDRAYQASHFLDGYVNNLCWRRNRTFSFYDKFWPSSKNKFFGQVTEDGLTLNVYTDSKRMNRCLSLPRPSAEWPFPSFKGPQGNYHNTSGKNNEIDWGFLLIGNAGGSGAGAHWATDPAAMAIMISIDRGVMHMDDGTDGTTAWTTPKNYYQGDNGKSIENTPILFYSSILHQLGYGGKAYALSYDDIYGEEPSIYFDNGSEVTVTLRSLETVKLPAVHAARRSL